MLVSLPDTSWQQAVGDIGGVTTVIDDLTGERPGRDDVEFLVPPYSSPPWDPSVLFGMPKLRLVQLLTAGFDGLVGRVPTNLPIANAAGVHDASTAELTVGLALASLRGIPHLVRAQQRHEWSPQERPSLADRRVLLVGYGHIGRAIAARLRPFEVALTALARRERAGDDLVQRVHGWGDLAQLLPHHDVVIIIVPLTDDTRGMVNDDFLNALPDGALVINVARGAVADTDAIVRHAGRLQFALDVVDPEPLPAAHPLWDASGVLLSAHTGGGSSSYRPRAAALIRRQIEIVLADGTPENLIAAHQLIGT